MKILFALLAVCYLVALLFQLQLSWFSSSLDLSFLPFRSTLSSVSLALFFWTISCDAGCSSIKGCVKSASCGSRLGVNCWSPSIFAPACLSSSAFMALVWHIISLALSTRLRFSGLAWLIPSSSEAWLPPRRSASSRSSCRFVRTRVWTSCMNRWFCWCTDWISCIVCWFRWHKDWYTCWHAWCCFCSWRRVVLRAAISSWQTFWQLYKSIQVPWMMVADSESLISSDSTFLSAFLRRVCSGATKADWNWGLGVILWCGIVR